MKQKPSLFLLFVGVCFLTLVYSCEAEKDFLQTSKESGKQMKREISFKQFKEEIDKPNFSTGMSLSISETGRNMEDFKIDTTLVKSLETNYVVYSMRLDPKFVINDNKFYNLLVYRDNNQELVKQIIEFLPQTEITYFDEQGIFNFLQNATKEIIYSSRLQYVNQICVEIVQIETCDCGPNHTRDQGCNCTTFHSTSQLQIVPCPTYGGPGPEIPNTNTGNDSNNTNNGGGNSDGVLVAADPVYNNSPINCISAAKLLEVFPNASLDTRTKLANHVRVYGGYFGINTKEELWHFLAQIGGETDGLTNFNGEDMDYATTNRLVKIYGSKFSLTNPNLTNPTPYLHNEQGLANFVYCCDNGNGDEASGDGWRYRGRGFMQLTWKTNYDGYHDYLDSIGLGWWYTYPDDLNLPDGIHAVLSAMWFFKNRVLDKMTIDTNTTTNQVTKRVNKRTDKASKIKRNNYFEKAKIKITC